MSNAAHSLKGGVLDPVLSEIMEAMTFAGVERVEEEEFDWDGADMVWARVDLIAPVEGGFWMVAPREAAIELTDVVWAGEIEANEDSAKALMAEFVNAVAGQLLAVLDENASVQVGLPETGQGKIRPCEYGEVRHAYFMDDGTPIGVLIRSAA